MLRRSTRDRKRKSFPDEQEDLEGPTISAAAISNAEVVSEDRSSNTATRRSTRVRKPTRIVEEANEAETEAKVGVASSSTGPRVVKQIFLERTAPQETMNTEIMVKDEQEVKMENVPAEGYVAVTVGPEILAQTVTSLSPIVSTIPSVSSVPSIQPVVAKRVEPMQNQSNPDMSHILNDCTEYIIDEVKLLHRNNSKDQEKIYLMCPICGSIDTHQVLGKHLNNVHRASFLRCPGKVCNGWKVNWKELQEHIEKHHFYVMCKDCSVHVEVRKFRGHSTSCGARRPKCAKGNFTAVLQKAALNQLPKQAQPVAVEPRQTSASGKGVPLILQPRSEEQAPKTLPPPSGSRAIRIEPKKTLRHCEQDRQVAVILGASPDYEVLLKGKLVVISGIYYYMKADVAFTDCPMCNDRAMALSVIGSHMTEDHGLTRIACHAEGCQAIVSSAVFQEHLMKQHGRIRCRGCSFILTLNSAPEHFDDHGKCLRAKIQGKVEEDAGRMNSYSVQSMQPSVILIEDDDPPVNQVMCDENSQSEPIEVQPDIFDPDDDDDGGVEAETVIVQPDVQPPEQQRPVFIPPPVRPSVKPIAKPPTKQVAAKSKTPTKPSQGGQKSTPGKIPTLPCPYCGKQCSYLKKHIRDVHQPKTNCPICHRRMGHSYLSEHMKIQHQGKTVPTKKCPICQSEVQKLKNHLKATHKMSREEADSIYDTYFPMNERNTAIAKAQNQFQAAERKRQYQEMSQEGLSSAVPETVPEQLLDVSIDVSENQVLVFEDD